MMPSPRELLRTLSPNSFTTSLLDEPGFSFQTGDSGSPTPGAGSAITAALAYRTGDEWTGFQLSLKNTGPEPIRVADVLSIDWAFRPDAIQDVRIHTFRGGMHETVFPPKSYNHDEVLLHPATPFPDTEWHCVYEIQSRAGRSSDNFVPVVILEDDARSCGLWIGVVWSGDWRLRFIKEKQTSIFRVSGGLLRFDMVLEPGEEVVFPEILVGTYSGDFAAGSNAVRRYIRREMLEKLPAPQRIPTVSYDHWFGLGAHIDEALLLKQVDHLDGMGMEYFVLDAGWYHNEHRGLEEFGYGVGNWTRVAKEKFPHGLKPLADYVRAKGMKMGLWFEPEGAYKTSEIARELPDCMLERFPGDEWPLVDFGRAEVIAYTQAYLRKHFEELGLEWIRFDFNKDPRAYWAASDRPGRTGEREMAHVRGVYSLLEWINREYPHVLIESCSSGGHRMDLGILRYSPTAWASDQTYHVHGCRLHYSNANVIFPGGYINRALCARGRTRPTDAPDYPASTFLTFFGGTFSIDDPVQTWSPSLKEKCRKYVAIYKQVRTYLNHDFYPLFPTPSSLEHWDGWQFHDPERDAGFLVVFRVHSPEATRRVRLRGLTDGAKYSLDDPCTGESFSSDSADLGSGLPVTLDFDGAQLLTYRRQ